MSGFPLGIGYQLSLSSAIAPLRPSSAQCPLCRTAMTGSQLVQEEIISYLPRNGKIIIDLADCDYVASSGLRVLLIIAKQSAYLSCNTVLASVHPMVWDVIEMTGFEDVLKVYKNKEEAFLALRGELHE